MNDITTRTVRRVDVGVPTAEAMMLAYRYAYVPPWGLYQVHDQLRSAIRAWAQWPQEVPLIMDLMDTQEGMTLAVTADPARLGRRDAEAVLRAAEALLVRAVHERVALREVPELVARALDGRR
jgi:hypothetical protein